MVSWKEAVAKAGAAAGFKVRELHDGEPDVESVEEREEREAAIAEQDGQAS